MVEVGKPSRMVKVGGTEGDSERVVKSAPKTAKAPKNQMCPDCKELKSECVCEDDEVEGTETPEAEQPDDSADQDTEPEPATKNHKKDTDETVGDHSYSIDKELFLKALSIVKTLGDESVIRISNKGITLTQIDASHIAMATVDFSHISYVGPEKPVMYSINLGEFITAAKTMKGTVVFVSCVDNLITVSGEGKKKYSTRMRNMVADIKMPKLDPPFILKLTDATGLKSTIKEIEKFKVSVHARIELVNDLSGWSMNVIAKGDTASYENSISIEPVTKEPKPVISTFPLDYFLNMCNLFETGDTITIGMGADYPIRVTIQQKGLEALYLIAPRIEN